MTLDWISHCTSALPWTMRSWCKTSTVGCGKTNTHPIPACFRREFGEGCQGSSRFIIWATIITVVVFPLSFALSGVVSSSMGLGCQRLCWLRCCRPLTVTPALCAILLPYGRLPEQEPWVARFFRNLACSAELSRRSTSFLRSLSPFNWQW